MKAFFAKVWSYILAHKVISIVTASVLVAGTSCAIVLPITLHKHDFAAEWSSDGDNHWHAATCSHEEEKGDLAPHVYDNACDATCNVCGATRTPEPHVYDNACDATCNVCGATRTPEPHVYDNACDATCNVCGATRTPEPHVYDNALTAGETTHYYLCSVCGDRKDEAAHAFTVESATSDYLKAAATATTNAQYWKSCTCGKASTTEFFETDKTAATLTDIQDLSKTYDKLALADPTYTTNSDGAVTIEWYEGATKLDAKPVNAGTYRVKVVIAESATYTGISAEREFTIAKVTVTVPTLEKVYDGYGEFEFVFAGPAGEEIDCLIGIDSENAGTYTDVAITDKSVSSDNYEITATTVSATITPKVLTGLEASFVYNGSAEQTSPALTTADGVLPADTDVVVKITFESADAEANPTGAVLFSASGAHTNYTLDMTTCVAEITPKVLNDVTYAFTYNGNEYQQTYLTSEDHSGIIGSDSVLLEVVFDSENVWATVLTSDPDMAPAFEEGNYVLGTYTFSIKRKNVTSLPSTLTAEYSGTNSLTSTVDIDGIEATLSFTATKDDNPISAVAEYTDVTLSDISLGENYTLNLRSATYTVNIVPKKLSYLDLRITEASYNSGKITLLAKDGIVPGESVQISITDFNNQDLYNGFSTFMELESGTSPDAYRYEIIALVASGDYANYELATYDDGNGYQIVGKVTCVESCEVQYDGSCNCGTSHIQAEIAANADDEVIQLLSDGWEGGIYRLTVTTPGTYLVGFTDNFGSTTLYDSEGNILTKVSDGYRLVAGVYYWHADKNSSYLVGTDGLKVDKTNGIGSQTDPYVLTYDYKTCTFEDKIVDWSINSNGIFYYKLTLDQSTTYTVTDPELVVTVYDSVYNTIAQNEGSFNISAGGDYLIAIEVAEAPEITSFTILLGNSMDGNAEFIEKKYSYYGSDNISAAKGEITYFFFMPEEEDGAIQDFTLMLRGIDASNITKLVFYDEDYKEVEATWSGNGKIEFTEDYTYGYIYFGIVFDIDCSSFGIIAEVQ